MDKRKLHHQFKFIKKMGAQYFLYIAIFFLALGIIGMRENNLRMIELREQVYIADEQGMDIEKPLRELRQYVHGHMNTDLSSGNVSIKPPVQLRHQYERLLKQEQQKANKVNQQVKEDGEQECARKFPGSGLNASRVNCVVEYMRVNTVDPETIPSELYKFDFISPVWSTDFAGLTLLASLVFFAIFIIRLAVGWWYKRELD